MGEVKAFREDDYTPSFILAKTLEMQEKHQHIAGIMVIELRTDGTHAVNCSSMSGKDVAFCKLAAEDYALALMRNDLPDTARIRLPLPEDLNEAAPGPAPNPTEPNQH